MVTPSTIIVIFIFIIVFVGIAYFACVIRPVPTPLQTLFKNLNPHWHCDVPSSSSPDSSSQPPVTPTPPSSHGSKPPSSQHSSRKPQTRSPSQSSQPPPPSTTANPLTPYAIQKNTNCLNAINTLSQFPNTRMLSDCALRCNQNSQCRTFVWGNQDRKTYTNECFLGDQLNPDVKCLQDASQNGMYSGILK